MYNTSAEQLKNILYLRLGALRYMMTVMKQLHYFQLFYTEISEG